MTPKERARRITNHARFNLEGRWALFENRVEDDFRIAEEEARREEREHIIAELRRTYPNPDFLIPMERAIRARGQDAPKRA